MTATPFPLASAGASPAPPASQRPDRSGRSDQDDRFDALVNDHLATDKHAGEQIDTDKPAGAKRPGRDRKQPTGDQARPAADPSTTATPAATATQPAGPGPAGQTGQPTQQSQPATAVPVAEMTIWTHGGAARTGLPVTRPTADPGTTDATAIATPSTTGPLAASGAKAATTPATAQAAQALVPQAPAPTTTPAGQSTATTGTADQAGAPAKHADTPEPAAAKASTDPAPSTAGNTPTVVPTTPAVAGTATAAAQNLSTPATAVLDQVLPTLPRMVSRGDGTHSLTLKLHPADLGEVHLTVTVKNGTVDVTLAAGAAARDALRDGAGQLRSILDVTGHTAGQLVIRDLPTTTAAPAAATDTTLTGQTFTDAGGGRGQQPDAGPGRGSAPHSGARPDPSGRAVPEPRTTTSTRAGTRALDVRI
jgi:flagellar hook-length control protein FliK